MFIANKSAIKYICISFKGFIESENPFRHFLVKLKFEKLDKCFNVFRKFRSMNYGFFENAV